MLDNSEGVEQSGKIKDAVADSDFQGFTLGDSRVKRTIKNIIQSKTQDGESVQFQCYKRKSLIGYVD